jgi:hypothetical protein
MRLVFAGHAGRCVETRQADPFLDDLSTFFDNVLGLDEAVELALLANTAEEGHIVGSRPCREAA